MKRRKNENAGNIILLPTASVASNPLHPRIYYDDAQMQNLTESIQQLGMLRPLTVIYDKTGEYYVISGERRYRAAIRAGMEFLPCIILDIDYEKAAMTALSENMHQKDLNYFEIAIYLERLHHIFDCSYEIIAENLCLKLSDINYYLRFLNFDAKMREKMIENGVTRRHAMILLRLPKEKREILLDEVIAKKLNVNMTANRCKEMNEQKKQSSAKVITFFKNTDIFINTVNRAVKMMKDSGIQADCVKNETEESVDYYIHIPKIG